MNHSAHQVPGMRCVSLSLVSFSTCLTEYCRPTALYSFSFSPNYVSKSLYPTGEEFRKYLHDVVDKFDLADKIQLNTGVLNLRYIEEDSEWEVTLSHLATGTGDWSEADRQARVRSSGPQSVYLGEEVIRAKTVISCVGILVEPNPWPSEIPGRDSFTGEVFHSARWRDDIDFTGKDVIVIGSGCSAAQIVPSLLKEPYNVKSLTEIMRSAPWVMPRLQEPFGQERYARWAPTIYYYFPVLGYLFRAFIFVLCELIWATVFQEKNVKWRQAIEKSTLQRTREIVPEKYHKLMTPNYSYACKRRVFDEEWLKSMSKPNFTLTNRTLKAVDGNELILGPPVQSGSGNIDQDNESQTHIKADIIVLANGFEATQWLHPLPVFGRAGKSIHDLWNERGGPQAYMGTAVDGFPNFFLVCGPNSASGHNSLILTIENMVSYITKIMKPVLKGEARFVEVKKDALIEWKDSTQRDLKKTVFAGCTSWYMDNEGFNSTMYP
jgi:cation diffusion facilitator CzcD-associated flavoprotein CzcO